MTTNGTKPDVLSVLERAHQRWAQRQHDEPAAPGYLEHLEKYLRPLLDEASKLDGSASTIDAGELNDLRTRIEAAERELATRTAAHDQLAGELQTARTELGEVRKQLAAAEGELELVRDERARLVDELGESRQRRGHDEQAVANVLGEAEKHKSAAAVLRQKLRRATERLERAEQHEHFYPWPDPAKPPEPCACGRLWPRLLDEDTEEVEPDLEPWDALWARLRVDLADWGQVAGR